MVVCVGGGRGGRPDTPQPPLRKKIMAHHGRQEQHTHRNCAFTEPLLFALSYHGDESNKASEGPQSTKDDHCNCLKAKGISGAIIIINGGRVPSSAIIYEGGFCKGYVLCSIFL